MLGLLRERMNQLSKWLSYTSDVPQHSRGRDRRISEFEVSLVYKVSPRTARAVQRALSRNPTPTHQKKKKKSIYTQRETGLYTILEFEFVVILSILSGSHGAIHNWKMNDAPRYNFNQSTVFSQNNCILKKDVSLNSIGANLEAFDFTLFCESFKDYIPLW